MRFVPIALASMLAAATKVQEPHQSLIDMCERLMISAPKNQLAQFRSLTKDLGALNIICSEF
jgi:hypothetical protein